MEDFWTQMRKAQWANRRTISTVSSTRTRNVGMSVLAAVRPVSRGSAFDEELQRVQGDLVERIHREVHALVGLVHHLALELQEGVIGQE